jgi:hypothetical protein
LASCASFSRRALSSSSRFVVSSSRLRRGTILLHMRRRSRSYQRRSLIFACLRSVDRRPQSKRLRGPPDWTLRIRREP